MLSSVMGFWVTADGGIIETDDHTSTCLQLFPQFTKAPGYADDWEVFEEAGHNAMMHAFDLGWVRIIAHMGKGTDHTKTDFGIESFTSGKVSKKTMTGIIYLVTNLPDYAIYRCDNAGVFRSKVEFIRFLRSATL